MRPFLCQKLFAAAVSAITLVSAILPQASLAQSTSDGSSSQQQPAEKSYYWTGVARFTGDIDHRDHSYAGSGIVHADSREEAIALATEALKAQASILGNVSDAHVSISN